MNVVGKAPEGASAFAVRAGASLIAVAFTAFSLGVAGVLSARLLGPEGKGTASVALVVLTVIATLALGSVDLWATAELGRSGWSGPGGGAIVRHSRVLSMGIGGCGVALAIATAIMGGPVAVVVASAVVVLGTAWMQLAFAIPLGLRRPRGYVAGQLVYGAVAVAGTSALVAADASSVAAVLLVLGLARILGSAVSVVVIRPDIGRPPGSAPPGRDLARFGIPASAGNALLLVLYRVDAVVVAALVSADAAGIYAVAASVTEVLWLVSDAVAAVLIAQVSESRSADLTARVVRVTVAAVAVLGAGAVVAAPHIVHRLFGAEFAGAVRVVGPLAVATVLLSVWKLLVADLAARHLGRPRLTSLVVGLCVMLLTDLVLVPRHGALGASLGAIAGYGAATAMAVRSWANAGGRPLSLFGLRRDDAHELWAALRARTPTLVNGGPPLPPRSSL